MKKFTLLSLILLISTFIFAQNEESMPKGLVQDNPVSTINWPYQTINSVDGLVPIKQWKNSGWTFQENGIEIKNYKENASLLIVSGLIKLPTLATKECINLSFDESFELESYHDFGEILVSDDNGANWIVVSSRSGRSSERNTYVSLSQFAGKEIKIAFRLKSDDSNNYAGWKVSEIKLSHDRIQKSTIRKASALNSVGNTTFIGVDAGNFPNTIFAQIKVKDDKGAAITGLGKDDFTVYEDLDCNTNGNATISKENPFMVYESTDTEVKKPVDIVFLMDNSGSMSDEQAAVANNVEKFVDNLKTQGYDYSLAICRFGQSGINGQPIIETGTHGYWFNNNGDDFVAYWKNTNVINGSIEPGYDAVNKCIQQLSFRNGAQRIFVLITDEMNNGASITDPLVINTLTKENSISLYCLVQPNPSESYTSYSPIANGGVFDITGDFSAILSNIEKEIQSTYTIRYEPNYKNFDGCVHNVRVDVKPNTGGVIPLSGHSYVAGEKIRVIRTQETRDRLSHAQTKGNSVRINVKVTDMIAPYMQYNATGDVNNRSFVTLYYRQFTEQGSNAYKALEMKLNTSLTGQSLTETYWSTEIPILDVLTPTMQYYVMVSDGLQTVTVPAIEKAAWDFAVIPNNPPHLTDITTYKPANDAYVANTSISFKVEAYDNDQFLLGGINVTDKITQVLLYYTHPSIKTFSGFEVVEMVKESGNVYSYNYTLPEGITGYYFKTYDNYGASTMVPLGADEYPNCITCALKEIVAVPAIIPPLTVSFDSQGGNFIATETYDPNTVSAFHEPVLIGNTFEGWFDNTGTKRTETGVWITESKILKAKWKAKTYVVSLDPDNGLTMPNVTYTYGGGEVKFDIPSKKNYSFTGWKDELGNMQTSTGKWVDETTKIVAQWKPQEFKILYILEPTNIVEGKYVYNSTPEALMLPEKDGYTFNGWYYDNKISPNLPLGMVIVKQTGDWITGDVRLYPDWISKTKQYTLSFVYDFESYVEAGVKKDFTIDKTYKTKSDGTWGTPVPLDVQNPERDYYLFYGWKDKTKTIRQYDGAWIDEDKLMTPNWLPIQHLVSFTGAVKPEISFDYDNHKVLDAPTTITVGSEFNGWIIDGYPTQVYTNTSELPVDTKKSSHVTLKAVWKDKEYTTTLLADDHFEGATITFTKTTNEVLPILSSHGIYEFVEWQLNGTKVTNTSDLKLVDNTKLNAKWKACQKDTFNAGNNLWCSYLDIKDTKFSTIFSTISADIESITDNFGNVWKPGSTTPSYTPGQGYAINMKVAKNTSYCVEDVRNFSTEEVCVPALEGTKQKINIIGHPYPYNASMLDVFTADNNKRVSKVVRIAKDGSVNSFYTSDAMLGNTIMKSTWLDAAFKPGMANYFFGAKTTEYCFAYPIVTLSNVPPRIQLKNGTLHMPQKLRSIHHFMTLFVPTTNINVEVDKTDEWRVYNAKGELLGRNYVGDGLSMVMIDALNLTDAEEVKLMLYQTKTKMIYPTKISQWNEQQSYSVDQLSLKYSYAADLVADKVEVDLNGGQIVSIKEVLTASRIKVFPNPANAQLTIAFSCDNLTTAKASVSTISGSVILQSPNVEYTPGDHTFTLDVASISNGIYLLKVEINSIVEIVKIVIKK